MAAKKRKSTKRTAGRTATPRKKKTQKRKSSKQAARKPAATRKVAKKKKKSLKQAGRASTASAGSPASAKGKGGGNAGRPIASRETTRSTSGGQSGDLQGLSNSENVDSESVDELIEEGNAFEAGVVAGVEDSQGHEGKEVRTREVPEDDVPEEYLDEE